MNKIPSKFNFSYEVEKRNFLNLNFYCLKSLDDSIDSLCEVLGQDKADDALKEDFCPYFGVPWEAGLGLAQYLNEIDFKGKSVFEIGSGLSLPSFIACNNNASYVLASDFHEDVKTFLDINQELNQCQFDFLRFNWRDKHSFSQKFDYVIGSDILYESAHPQYVAEALIEFLNPKGRIILADPGRAYVQKFVLAMNQLGYREQLSIVPVMTNWTQKDIFVFEYTIT